MSWAVVYCPLHKVVHRTVLVDSVSLDRLEQGVQTVLQQPVVGAVAGHCRGAGADEPNI